MKERLLGRTGLRVSEIGFGAWAIGGNAYGPVCDEDSLKALDTAWSSGLNFFDTADIYGEGHSEALLGRFLKGKPRGQIVVATKAGWDFYPASAKAFPGKKGAGANHAGHRKNFDPFYIRFACEQSLKRLGVETIDLFQLHNPSLELIRKKELTGVLEDLKKEGKIRFVGISVHTEAEALAALEDPQIDALQVIFNLLDQRMATKIFPEAKRKSIALIAREPLAHGLLTGKYPPAHEFPKDDHRRRWVREKRELDWEKIRRLRKVLDGKSIPLAQAALEYALTFDAVSAVIPGAKTREQVAANLEASFNPGLTPEEIRGFKELYEREPVFREGLIPR
ncbi:MAG TPA: aldo/keto reductase [Candidatus Omnitrophota bacterium]|nr:aldo/keto reductase [Candidatus Omnitrophota bacterium]HPS37189.1 aldo/keto reductase [Candidatus Omnitrophota bacterium]